MPAGVVTSGLTTDSGRPRLPHGMVPWWGTHTIAATTEITDVGDDFLLWLFDPAPYNSMIPNSTIGFMAQLGDIDTNGTPLVTVDFGLGDSDGVIDIVLVNDTTIGRTGGGVQLDRDLDQPPWIVAQALYMIMTIVAAPATDAVGTISVGGCYSAGVLELTA